MGEFIAVMMAAAGFVAVIMVFVVIVKQFLYVGRPNEILIFSGRDRLRADGSHVGFRTVIGGRTIKIPILETVNRMDLRVIPVTISIEGAYSQGGIPLNVHAIANVKLSSDPDKIDNAIERFLGRDRNEVARVARETLEGNLRGVLANLTPEQVNEDRLGFVKDLRDDVEPDFEKLGLHLDTLKIQSVSDTRDYLESIGRKRLAEILKQAEVAESNAMKAAEESEAQERGRSEVARREAQAQIQKAQNELRQLTADLELDAKSEEEKATARALAARAEAEQELQKVRTDLETIRLEADVVIPARTEKTAREIIAAGEAAEIAEKGRALAEVLRMMTLVWAEAGDAALDVFMLNRMEEIMQKVAEAARQVEVRQVALIDSGDGTSLPNYVSSFPKIVASIFDEMRSTIGLDISGALQGRAGDGSLGSLSSSTPLSGASFATSQSLETPSRGTLSSNLDEASRTRLGQELRPTRTTGINPALSPAQQEALRELSPPSRGVAGLQEEEYKMRSDTPSSPPQNESEEIGNYKTEQLSAIPPGSLSNPSRTTTAPTQDTRPSFASLQQRLSGSLDKANDPKDQDDTDS